VIVLKHSVPLSIKSFAILIRGIRISHADPGPDPGEPKSKEIYPDPK